MISFRFSFCKMSDGTLGHFHCRRTQIPGGFRAVGPGECSVGKPKLLFKNKELPK